MAIETLAELEFYLSKYTAKEIFNGDAENVLKKLRLVCHPDKFAGNPVEQARASALFIRLSELSEEAVSPQVIIKSPKTEYTVQRLFATGDVADIYTTTADGKFYLLKISRVAGADKMLEVEKTAIANFLTVADASTYSNYFPLLVESFPVHTGKLQKRVNVFAYDPDFVSLERGDIHGIIGPLPGQHLAWIFNRMLTGLAFTHRCGWVHGAMLPCHMLIRASDHAGRLVGWGQAVEIGKPVKSLSTKWKDHYAPEVLAKKPVTAETDIYMAAKAIIYLSGGDVVRNTMPATVNPKMCKFINGCLLQGQSMRPGNAWDLADEWKAILKIVYGPPKFVPLEI